MPGKISELAALATLDAADFVEVLDTSDTSMAASGTNKRVTVATFALRAIVTHSGTSITAALTDVYPSWLRFTGSNPTYTLPLNSAVAFPVGSQIEGISTATAMTIAATGGVTTVKARTLVTVGAGSAWTAIKSDTDTWDIIGDFA